jgi:hypothetical protein
MQRPSWEQVSRWILAATASALALTVSCATPPPSQPPQRAQLAQAVAAPSRLHPSEQLSGTARVILRSRMASHARDMGDLMSEIMLLQYPEVSAGALRLAGDASLSRPLTEDATELNSALPEKFFLYQDALRLEARTLSESARRENPFDVADSYGRLSQVCVRCHATYRAGR